MAQSVSDKKDADTENKYPNLNEAVDAVENGIRISFTAIIYNIPFSVLFQTITERRKLSDVKKNDSSVSKDSPEPTNVEPKVCEIIEDSMGQTYSKSHAENSTNCYKEGSAKEENMEMQAKMESESGDTKPIFKKRKPLLPIVNIISTRYSLQFPNKVLAALADWDSNSELKLKTVAAQYSINCDVFCKFVYIVRSIFRNSNKPNTSLLKKLYNMFSAIDSSYSDSFPDTAKSSRMQKAVSRILSGGISVKRAAYIFKLPYTNLWKYVKSLGYEPKHPGQDKGESKKSKKSETVKKRKSLLPLVNRLTKNWSLQFPSNFLAAVTDWENDNSLKLKCVAGLYSIPYDAFCKVFYLIRSMYSRGRTPRISLIKKLHNLFSVIDYSYSAPLTGNLSVPQSSHTMEEATTLILNGRMGVKRASSIFKLSYTSLLEHAKSLGYVPRPGARKGIIPVAKGSDSATAAPVVSSTTTIKRSASKNKGSKPSSSNAQSELCVFCQQPEGNEIELGKMHALDGIKVHYYCLLFSSALEQNGQDNEGVLGFLLKDIKKEVARGSKLKCHFCNKVGATIGCNSKMCRRTYHFPCGLENHVQFVFTGNFRSMCAKHRQYQTGVGKGEEVQCPICLQNMIADPRHAVWSPCCRKSSWFHNQCLKTLALSAGYFFKCPLCNDKNTFIPEMLRHGIYVPEQDASWELEPNAFQDLLERPIRCEAKKCRCPAGRKNDKVGTRWEVILCYFCGSTGVHLACVKLKVSCQEWHCSTCSDIILESTRRSKFEERKQRSHSRARKRPDSIDSASETEIEPPPKRKKDEPISHFADTSFTRVKVTDELSDVDINDSEETDGILPSTFTTVPKDVPSEAFLSEYIVQNKTLPQSLLNLKDYIEALPARLASYKFDDVTFLHTLNTLSDKRDELYKIDLNQYKRFLSGSFNYDQMMVLRNVFERVFLITSLKYKHISKLKAKKHNPFSTNSRRLKINVSHKKKIDAFQIGLSKLLTEAKAINLLEGNNTWSNHQAQPSVPSNHTTGEDTQTSLVEPDSALEESASSSVRYDNSNKLESLNIPNVYSGTKKEINNQSSRRISLRLNKSLVECPSVHCNVVLKTTNVIDNVVIVSSGSEKDLTIGKSNRINAENKENVSQENRSVPPNSRKFHIAKNRKSSSKRPLQAQSLNNVTSIALHENSVTSIALHENAEIAINTAECSENKHSKPHITTSQPKNFMLISLSLAKNVKPCNRRKRSKKPLKEDGYIQTTLDKFFKACPSSNKLSESG